MWYDIYAGKGFPDALNGGIDMKRYEVSYGFGSYDYERTFVYADSKAEVRRIMRREVGSGVVIHEIEEVE